MFFFLLEFQLNTFTDPCPTAASAATCVLCNSTCKLIISTDMIIEIQITKLLAKLLTESSGDSKGGPGWAMLPQIFGWPPQFFLNFPFKFFWLTYTVEKTLGQQYFKR